MNNWMMSFLTDFGYIGILLLMLLENIAPLISSEIILIYSSLAALTIDVSNLGILIIATLGSVVGAMLLYSVGLVVNVEKLLNKLKRHAHFVPHAEKWLQKHQLWVIPFGRFIPGVRGVIALFSGMTGISISTFIALTTIGSLTWNSFLIYMWDDLHIDGQMFIPYINLLANGVYLFIGISGCLLALYSLRFRRKRA